VARPTRFDRWSRRCRSGGTRLPRRPAKPATLRPANQTGGLTHPRPRTVGVGRGLPATGRSRSTSISCAASASSSPRPPASSPVSSGRRGSTWVNDSLFLSCPASRPSATGRTTSSSTKLPFRSRCRPRRHRGTSKQYYAEIRRGPIGDLGGRRPTRSRASGPARISQDGPHAVRARWRTAILTCADATAGRFELASGRCLTSGRPAGLVGGEAARAGPTRPPLTRSRRSGLKGDAWRSPPAPLRAGSAGFAGNATIPHAASRLKRPWPTAPAPTIRFAFPPFRAGLITTRDARQGEVELS